MVVDETSDAKKGTRMVGVQRKYTRTVGRTVCDRPRLVHAGLGYASSDVMTCLIRV
ncbi:hypothetical protein [Streptomyces sp. NBC_01723]|uniref:hypothetical protein n=1 Tax=Streptomyces sp. NBC_01723 TaxID=2975921 RepID=UPI003FCE907A